MTDAPLFDFADPAMGTTSPCATEPGRCTSCVRPVCLTYVAPCSGCDRLANAEVSVSSWFKPRRKYVVHGWAASCWWCLGQVTDQLRAAAVALHPAYVVTWTAKPWGILAGGTTASARVEQVAA